MKIMKISVYDDHDQVVKTSEAQLIDLRFGTIRSLMELLNIEEIEDVGEMLKKVYSAWDQVVLILGKCFPDMEYDDWENVKLKELVPVIMDIIRFSFAEILKIPKDSKN